MTLAKNAFKDRDDLLQELELKARLRRNLQLTEFDLRLGEFEKYKTTLKQNEDFFTALHRAFESCGGGETDVILSLMSNKVRDSAGYTQLLGKMLLKLYQEHQQWKSGKFGWQPTKAAIVESMCCYHPKKEVRVMGLEILISHDIGSGWGSHDIGGDICFERYGCKLIVDEYFSAQDYEGHWKYDSQCAVHSDSIYNSKLRKNLLSKWRLITNN